MTVNKVFNFRVMIAVSAVLTLGVTADQARATTFANRTLGEVVKEAAVIVRGRAGDSYSDWDKAHQRIYTYTTFKVTDVLKGELKENSILVRQPGGSKDGLEMNVPGAASFSSDEDLVLLLGSQNQDDKSYDVPGFTTGKYIVSTNDAGEPVLTNSLGSGAVYDPRKDARTLSYSSQIPLEVFRKLAKGEDIPEANHKQFRESEKPAPKGAFEAEHPHASENHFNTPGPDSGVPERTPNSEDNLTHEQGVKMSWSAAAAAFFVAIAIGFAVRAYRKRRKDRERG